MGPDPAEQSRAKHRESSHDKETATAVALQCCIPVATGHGTGGAPPDSLLSLGDHRPGIYVHIRYVTTTLSSGSKDAIYHVHC